MFSRIDRDDIYKHKKVRIRPWIAKQMVTRMEDGVFTKSTPEYGTTLKLECQQKQSIILIFQQSAALIALILDWVCLSLKNLYEAKPKVIWPLPGKTLIADDDSLNLELLRNYLKKLIVCYDTVYDGDELAKKVKKSSADECSLIIIDNNMPKIDGIYTADVIADFLMA